MLSDSLQDADKHNERVFSPSCQHDHQQPKVQNELFNEPGFATTSRTHIIENGFFSLSEMSIFDSNRHRVSAAECHPGRNLACANRPVLLRSASASICAISFWATGIRAARSNGSALSNTLEQARRKPLEFQRVFNVRNVQRA